jgi:hypothetical protein
LIEGEAEAIKSRRAAVLGKKRIFDLHTEMELYLETPKVGEKRRVKAANAANAANAAYGAGCA